MSLLCRLAGKLADFGLARRLSLEAGGSALAESDGYGPVNVMAPESLMPPFIASPASDAYMFGMLMWEVMEERVPFGYSVSREVVMSRVRYGTRPGGGRWLVQTSSLWRRDVVALYESCTERSVALRPTMPGVVSRLDATL